MPHPSLPDHPDKTWRRHAPGPVRPPVIPVHPAARALRLTLVLLRALRGRAMPLALKISLGGGPLVYFFLPNDFIPDATPKTGRLDDLAVLATACVVALVYDPETRERVRARFNTWVDTDAPAQTGRPKEEVDEAADGQEDIINDTSPDDDRPLPDTAPDNQTRGGTFPRNVSVAKSRRVPDK